jgi:hypothetical protein
MSQDNVEGDLSGGGLSGERMDLNQELIEEKRQFRTFRMYTFILAVAIVIILLGMMICWVNYNMKKANVEQNIFVFPIVVFASTMSVFGLALMKYVYQSGEKKSELADSSVLAKLAKEIIGLIRSR